MEGGDTLRAIAAFRWDSQYPVYRADRQNATKPPAGGVFLVS